jgi:hypothetical protein
MVLEPPIRGIVARIGVLGNPVFRKLDGSEQTNRFGLTLA